MGLILMLALGPAGEHNNTDVRRKFLTRGLLLVALLPIAVAGAWTRRSRPVWLELLHETDCACGDFHEEVTGYTLLNPFRDRTPERAVDSFFEQLKTGKCGENVYAGVCQYATEEVRPVLRWKLMNRKDSAGRISLYYRLKGKSQPDRSLVADDIWGEGLVEVQANGNTLKITGYGAYY